MLFSVGTCKTQGRTIAVANVLSVFAGFSFKGEPREPFKEPLEAFNNDVSDATEQSFET